VVNFVAGETQIKPRDGEGILKMGLDGGSNVCYDALNKHLRGEEKYRAHHRFWGKDSSNKSRF
jgi:hypothetical protein